MLHFIIKNKKISCFKKIFLCNLLCTTISCGDLSDVDIDTTNHATEYNDSTPIKNEEIVSNSSLLPPNKNSNADMMDDSQESNFTTKEDNSTPLSPKNFIPISLQTNPHPSQTSTHLQKQKYIPPKSNRSSLAHQTLPTIQNLSPHILNLFKNVGEKREGLKTGEWVQKTPEYKKIKESLQEAFDIHEATQTDSEYLKEKYFPEKNSLPLIISQIEDEYKKKDFEKNKSFLLFQLTKLRRILTIEKKTNFFSDETEFRYVGENGIPLNLAKEAFKEISSIIDQLKANGISPTTFNQDYELSLKNLKFYKTEFFSLQNLIGGKITPDTKSIKEIKNSKSDSLIKFLIKNKINPSSSQLKTLFCIQEVAIQLKNINKGQKTNMDDCIANLTAKSYNDIKNLIDYIIKYKNKWQWTNKFLLLIKFLYLFTLTIKSFGEINPSGESLNLDIYTTIKEHVEEEQRGYSEN